MNKRNIGGYFSGIRKRLRALGVSEKVIAEAVVIGGSRRLPLRLSKTIKSRLRELLVKPHDRCVLTMGPSGKVRVYSFAGFKTTQGNVKHAVPHNPKHIKSREAAGVVAGTD